MLRILLSMLVVCLATQEVRGQTVASLPASKTLSSAGVVSGAQKSIKVVPVARGLRKMIHLPRDQNRRAAALRQLDAKSAAIVSRFLANQRTQQVPRPKAGNSDGGCLNGGLEEGGEFCGPGFEPDLWLFIDEWRVSDPSSGWFEELSTVTEINPERIEIRGQQPCKITVVGVWGRGDALCDEVSGFFDQDIPKEHYGQPGGDSPVADAVDEWLGSIVDIAIPVLSRCTTTPLTNAVQTPSQDVTYYVAAASILDNYAGNRDALREGVRADVKYPNGDVVRYIITGASGLSTSQPSLTLKRFIDGIPKVGTSPC